MVYKKRTTVCRKWVLPKRKSVIMGVAKGKVSENRCGLREMGVAKEKVRESGCGPKRNSGHPVKLFSRLRKETAILLCCCFLDFKLFYNALDVSSLKMELNWCR